MHWSPSRQDYRSKRAWAKAMPYGRMHSQVPMDHHLSSSKQKKTTDSEPILTEEENKHKRMHTHEMKLAQITTPINTTDNNKRSHNWIERYRNSIG